MVNLGSTHLRILPWFSLCNMAIIWRRAAFSFVTWTLLFFMSRTRRIFNFYVLNALFFLFSGRWNAHPFLTPYVCTSWSFIILHTSRSLLLPSLSSVLFPSRARLVQRQLHRHLQPQIHLQIQHLPTLPPNTSFHQPNHPGKIQDQNILHFL
jgi:hypothetical protein